VRSPALVPSPGIGAASFMGGGLWRMIPLSRGDPARWRPAMARCPRDTPLVTSRSRRTMTRRQDVRECRAGAQALRPGRRSFMPSDTSEKRDRRQTSAVQAAAEAMRSHGLSYPGAHEDFPWEGDRALKVKGKVFVFMGMAPDELSFSVKLPRS